MYEGSIPSLGITEAGAKWADSLVAPHSQNCTIIIIFCEAQTINYIGWEGINSCLQETTEFSTELNVAIYMQNTQVVYKYSKYIFAICILVTFLCV